MMKLFSLNLHFSFCDFHLSMKFSAAHWNLFLCVFCPEKIFTAENAEDAEKDKSMRLSC